MTRMRAERTTRAYRGAGVIVLLMLALLLQACASAARKDCESSSWDSLGFRDGLAGRSIDRVATLADRCADYDITVDAVAFESGYRRGLDEFCQPGNGFDLGEAAEPYGGVCRGAAERPFVDSYVRGLGIARDQLKLDYDQLNRALDRDRRALTALDDDESPKKLDQRIDELETRLQRNLTDRRDVNRRIARWSRDL